MCKYMVYTSKYKQVFIEKLEESIDEGSLVVEEVVKDGMINGLCFDVDPTNERQCEKLTHIIGDIIQKKIIEEVVKGYLKSRDDLSKIEKEEIKKAFLHNNYLSREDGYSSITYYLIYIPLLEEIKKSVSFNMDGWMTFRTSKYKVLLQDTLEQFIVDYTTKKEIVSFIKVMREISHLSAPLEEVLHIMYDENGILNMYNISLHEVTRNYIKKYCRDLVLDSTLSREDLILNILITVCPEHIIVHKAQLAKEPQFLKMLEIIFDKNLIYCMGCRLCE